MSELWNRPGTTLVFGLLGLFVIVNVITGVAFYFDKRRATQQAWRIPESSLLLWSFIGGWFGAKWAQQCFRHKTRKEPFRTMLNAIPFAWAATATLVWYLAGRTP
ncbi:DUF1294 domain-containing protein [Marivita hallyeonensis]|uniref:Uncharacterized membrane protein YsdA, DUF1294 family n=1 Tax=Marivita hallyeonensis TaxID=996342 RepID=A0A1M5M987_9RHOB|nr:DUF1294 domain-containing protein [Marivita hallyeonensis]SHG73832.1 Uncharacterized membrane protein YsdA, DUF1294 family [Marivita hallyeonensis]